ncbi:MAG: hypothetical protein ACFFDN_43710 [Candidatus Hodarchaeota archaeon]
MEELQDLPIVKSKWLSEAYMSCFSEYKSAYQISREIRGYVHYNYKKHMEENSNYFNKKKGKQKGDTLWKAKSLPILEIISSVYNFNQKEKKNLTKLLDDDRFRLIIKWEYGFRELTDIIDFIAIFSSVSYITKAFKDYKKLEKPKGMRTEVFKRLLQRKSINNLEKIFPYLKQLDNIDTTINNVYNIQNLFEKFSKESLSKLMRISFKHKYVPELIGSTLSTTEALYDILYKKKQ